MSYGCTDTFTCPCTSGGVGIVKDVWVHCVVPVSRTGSFQCLRTALGLDYLVCLSMLPINAKVCLVLSSNFYRGETSCTENIVESGENGTRVDNHIPGDMKEWGSLHCCLSWRETRRTYFFLLLLLKAHAT